MSRTGFGAAFVTISLLPGAAVAGPKLVIPTSEYRSEHTAHFSTCPIAPTSDSASRLVEALEPAFSHEADGMLVTVDADGWRCTMTPIFPGHASQGFQQAVRQAHRSLPTHGDRTIAYVNGMRVTPDIECETLRGIQAATGAAAVGIYNATDGIGGDLFEAVNQLATIDQHIGLAPVPAPPSEDKPVQTLRQIILGEVLGGRPPEIWAHSQGAAITSLALVEARDLLAKKGKSLRGVKVTSFAGAAPNWPDGPEYEHYIHTLDAVPRYSGLGRLAWLDRFYAGTKAKVVRFSGSAGRFSGPDGGMPSMTDHHDILAVYLPRWRQEHRGGR